MIIIITFSDNVIWYTNDDQDWNRGSLGVVRKLRNRGWGGGGGGGGGFRGKVITVLHGERGMPKWLQYYMGGSIRTPKSDYVIVHCARLLSLTNLRQFVFVLLCEMLLLLLFITLLNPFSKARIKWWGFEVVPVPQNGYSLNHQPYMAWYTSRLQR